MLHWETQEHKREITSLVTVFKVKSLLVTFQTTKLENRLILIYHYNTLGLKTGLLEVFLVSRRWIVHGYTTRAEL